MSTVVVSRKKVQANVVKLDRVLEVVGFPPEVLTSMSLTELRELIAVVTVSTREVRANLMSDLKS